jgi:hypothetical protein
VFLAGWFLGGLTLWFHRRYRVNGEEWGVGLSGGRQLSFLTSSAVVAFLGTQAVAQELNLMGAGAAGFILGGGIGALVGGKHVTFRGDGAGWQRIARFGIGITGVLLFLGAPCLPILCARRVHSYEYDTGLLSTCVFAGMTRPGSRYRAREPQRSGQKSFRA